MSDINHVILIGRLGRDAELSHTNSGLAFSKFSICVNKSKKNQASGAYEQEPNWFDCTYWGKGAEAVHQYLSKGKLIGIDGELRQNCWEKDGQSRSKVEIIVNNVQLLGSLQKQEDKDPF